MKVLGFCYLQRQMVKQVIRTLLVLLCYQAEAVSLDNTVSLASGDDYFPYSDSRLPEGGWSHRVVRAVLEEMGQQYQTDILPWARAEAWTKEHKYIAAFPYIETPERLADFYFSAPLHVSAGLIYTSVNNPSDRIEDFRGKLICLPVGFPLSESAKQFIQAHPLTVTYASNFHACFEQVHKGWSELLWTPPWFQPKLKEGIRFKRDFKNIPGQFSPLKFRVMVSKTHPQASTWLQRFNQALSKLEKNGQKAEIDNEYEAWLEQNLDKFGK